MYYIYVEEDGNLVLTESERNLECLGATESLKDALVFFNELHGIKDIREVPVSEYVYAEDEDDWWLGGN